MRGGVIAFQKVPKFEKDSIIFNLMKTLHSYLFALKMANNTLISQIVVDFVSKFSIVSEILEG